jgi:hypothetical protein
MVSQVGIQPGMGPEWPMAALIPLVSGRWIEVKI